MAELRKRGEDFWAEFEFYLSDLVVGLVLDVVLVGLIAPVAVIGRAPKAATATGERPGAVCVMWLMWAAACAGGFSCREARCSWESLIASVRWPWSACRRAPPTCSPRFPPPGRPAQVAGPAAVGGV